MGISWRIITITAISVFLAGSVAWVSVQAQNVPEPPPASVSAVPMEKVLFASAAVAAGEEIAADLIRSVEMRADQAAENLLRDTAANRAALVRYTANRSIPMGTPFVVTDGEAPPPEGPEILPAKASTAALLGPGMRAIALPIAGETAISRLINRGDRIDVMVSYTNADGIRAIRTVLHNVRVIGTDREGTEHPGRAAAKTLTLELHPEAAKVLALARQTGELVLVLSGPGAGDMPVISKDAPMLATQISGRPTVAAPKKTSVRIFRGARASQSQTPGALQPEAEALSSRDNPPPDTVAN